MSEIKERLLEALEATALTNPGLEKKTGIQSSAWKNLKNTNIRANEDHFEGLVKAAPEYIFWVMTGRTIREAGQIKPGDSMPERAFDIALNPYAINDLPKKESEEQKKIRATLKRLEKAKENRNQK